MSSPSEQRCPNLESYFDSRLGSHGPGGTFPVESFFHAEEPGSLSEVRSFHFVTFSCYRSKPLLGAEHSYRVFEQELELVRCRYGFVVAGCELMAERVHLLAGETRIAALSIAIQVLKQQTSRKLKGLE